MKEDQTFTVIRKGDDQEKDWWWVKDGSKKGYVPRNLLAVSNIIKCFKIVFEDLFPLIIVTSPS